MSELRITTWNINSVRLRADLVLRLMQDVKPHILCLQETKCPNDAFPKAVFEKAGFKHIAINGIKGYHGVAILSRLPFASVRQIDFCDRQDGRHLETHFENGGAGVSVHNFYIPAGGDEPDPQKNDKFAHKLAFVDEMTQRFHATQKTQQATILCGDFNIAPYEHDVWSSKQLQKVVSHTPVERAALDKLQKTWEWNDVARHFVAHDEKLYSWWSYRARDWAASDRGRRLDHIWTSAGLGGHLKNYEVLRQARGWERPSDHVPVTLTLKF